MEAEEVEEVSVGYSEKFCGKIGDGAITSLGRVGC